MRVSQWQKELPAEGVMVEDPVDLFYLTGLKLSRGSLVLTKQKSALFVDGRYIAKAKQESPCPVFLIDETAVGKWFHEQSVKTVAFDSAWTSVDRYETLKKQMKHLELIGICRLLKKQRVCKETKELQALKAAAALTWEGYQHVISSLKEGISEQELSLAFELFVRKKGASGLSFEPIIAFGKNSAYPHHRAGKTRLEKNQVVLIDVGAVVDDYRGDLTRVHFFGSPDPELEKMLSWTKKAQQAAINLISPGASFGQLDEAAREVFRSHGVESLFQHSLGHGIGLETHEYPTIKTKGPDSQVLLEQGMVFTIEPGLYKEGLGGVRFEDMVVVTSSGVERLFP